MESSNFKLTDVPNFQLCRNVSQDARRQAADDALCNDKRLLHFKVSRFRYLAARGGMAVAVRRCITGIFSRRLGVALLGHTPHVGHPLGAPLCSAVHGEQEDLAPRCAGEGLQTFWTRASTNTVVRRKAKLHDRETMDVDKQTTWIAVRKQVMQKSTLADLHETTHGTACGMYAMYLTQLSSCCFSRATSLETLTQQRANQTDGVTVSTAVVFDTDSG